MMSSTVIAMVLESGWPPHVSPCAKAARPLANGSATLPCTSTPPRGACPAVTPLAKVIMSGTTPNRSDANQWPTRPKPVMTSSATSRMPCRSQISRSPCQ